MLSRRFLLLAGTASWVSPAAALTATPAETAGPFYPRRKPTDRDDDLVQVAGHDGSAQGQVIIIQGSVRDLAGRPVAGATVEIWQANTHGRYDHPNDSNPAPLDPDFQGFGIATTDGGGGFRFRTVKPGAYADRTPHIHVQVLSPERRLVTQMYFPGEATNQRDSLFKPALLLTPVAASAYRFDFVFGS